MTCSGCLFFVLDSASICLYIFTMEIIRADVLGFCMGVCRAVDSVKKILAENEKTGLQPDIYTMGPLIHNPGVLKSLEEQGVKILEKENIADLREKSVVVIRAHGVPPEIYNALEEKKAVIIDSTCPKVKGSQKKAEKYSKMGFKVILAGDGGHGEVLGIAGFAGENFILVQNRSEAENLFADAGCFSGNQKIEKAVLLAQTTFSPVEFEAIKNILKSKIENLETFNSICSATQERQDALVKLCSETDGVIVVGGKNSANTRRLYLKAKSLCRHAALVENQLEVPPEFYKLEKVGIAAGASTPFDVIEAVEQQLRKGSAELNSVV